MNGCSGPQELLEIITVKMRTFIKQNVPFYTLQTMPWPYAHTHARARMPTHARTHVRTNIHTHAHTYSHTHIQMRTVIHKQTHIVYSFTIHHTYCVYNIC